MPASYTGLYVQRAIDGTICRVNVVDADGNTIPLKPEIYLERGVGPCGVRIPI